MPLALLNGDEEAAAWWQVAGQTCIAAYQSKGAASLAASYVNLANPGVYDLVVGSLPSWDTAMGWQGGNPAYLRTGIVPSALSWTWIVRVAGTHNDGGYPWGLVAQGQGYSTIPNFAQLGNTRIYYVGTNYAQPGVNLTSGDYLMGLAGFQPYLDGAPDGAAVAGSVYAAQTQDIFVLARNNNGLPAFHTTSNVLAWCCYDAALSAGEMAAIMAAMAAL